MHTRYLIHHWISMTHRLPYGIRIFLLVFIAAWTALLVHEIAHAVTAMTAITLLPTRISPPPCRRLADQLPLSIDHAQPRHSRLNPR